MRKAYFYLIVAAALWGSSIPVVKLGLLHGYDSLGFLWARLSMAALLSLFFLKPSTARSLLSQKSVWFWGLCNAGGFIFQFLGQREAPANQAAVLLNTSVIFVALLSALFLKERLRWPALLGIALAFGGMVLVEGGGRGRWAFHPADIFLVMAPLLWSVFILISKGLSQKWSQVSLLVPLNMVTFLFVAPIFPWSHFPREPLFYLLSLYMALFCTVIPYWFYFQGLRRVTPTVASLLNSAQIFFSILFGCFFLSERLTVPFFVGLAAVFGGIVLVESTRSGKEGKQEDSRV